MRPVLVAIEGDEPKSRAQIRDIVASALNVSDEDRQVMLPSGKQAMFTNRVAWAITHMAQAGLLDRPERGRYLLSDRGKTVLKEHPGRVDMSVLSQFPEYQEFRARKTEKDPDDKSTSAVFIDELSPSEAVGRLVEESYDTLAAELLDRILAQPPTFLETLSLKLLRAMGYGGREALLEHTGKSGDSGLDGLVRQDALGLDLVRFSDGARQFADSVGMRLRLIDGRELTKLMVRYNVGVQVRETFELKQIDEEEFEE